jgi:hypothetical protein
LEIRLKQTQRQSMMLLVPSLRLLLLPITRVLALLRVPQLLLPQVPVRLVRRRRDELAALQEQDDGAPGR